MTSQMSLVDVPVDTRARVRQALKVGGRAKVTVTSKATGKHLTVRIACKTKDGNDRWISRARLIGRVGFDDAIAVFCDADDLAVQGWAATLWTESNQWTEPNTVDDPRMRHYAWAARRVVQWALSGVGDPEFDEMASVELVAECSVCGRQLKDPESIGRGIGPECFGRATRSEHA